MECVNCGSPLDKLVPATVGRGWKVWKHDVCGVTYNAAWLAARNIRPVAEDALW